jgi:FeS assembly SUF system regulator
MLKVTRLTDYALVLLWHLSSAPDEGASAREAAAATQLPLPTVRKLLKRLAQAGLVEAHRGAHGGYRLVARPDRINIADVIAAIDGPVALTECASHSPDCNRLKTCSLRPNWLLISAALRRALKDISLEDMSRPLPRGRLQLAHWRDESSS